MQSTKLPLITSGVSPLIHDYLTGNSNLENLHNGLPSTENIRLLATDRDFSDENRTVLVDSVYDQYGKLEMHPQVEKNLSALRKSSSRTITTGHQLCLALGPFYMVSKVCSAIALAAKMNQKDYSHEYVPVFWMATEDHDFDEINHLHLFNKPIEWDHSENGAVGRMNTDGIQAAIAQMAEILGEEFTDSDLHKLLVESYSEENLAKATRRLFNDLFGEYGLIIVDGDSRSLKSLFIPVIQRELESSFSEPAIDQTSKQLVDAGYKRQINSRPINLFFLAEGYRERIVRKDNGFETVNGTYNWTKDEILSSVDRSPESFSPNVALRPVYQEMILPNVAYIGGGGEIAYWLQLKGVFDTMDLAFPALVVRESTLIINKNIGKKISSLGLSKEQLFSPVQDVVKSLLSSETPNWEVLIQGISSAWIEVEKELELIDPTLSKSAASENAKSAGTLKALQAKALRAVKEKNDTQVRQVEAVNSWVYPNGVLQERYANMLQFGTSQIRPLIKYLIDEFEPGSASMHVISFDEMPF
jgi:bacillithiol synthase